MKTLIFAVVPMFAAAAMTDVAGFPGKWKADFNADEHRMPYLEWFDEQPVPEKRNGICMILISGGGYACCCDVELLKMWRECFSSIIGHRVPRACRCTGGFTGLVNGESVSQERLLSLGVFAQFPFAERIGFAGCRDLTRPEIRNVRVRVGGRALRR